MELLISIFVALLIVGGLLYAVRLIPIEPWVKQVINILVFLVLVVWLLHAFGLYNGRFTPC